VPPGTRTWTSCEPPRKTERSTIPGSRSSPVSACGRLLDRALVHHRDPVAHRERLVLIVGDEHESDPELRLQPLELDLEVRAELRVSSWIPAALDGS
jgi:hypothetical protein